MTYDPSNPTEIPILSTFEDISKLLALLPTQKEPLTIDAIRADGMALKNLSLNISTLRQLGRDPATSNLFDEEDLDNLTNIIESQYSADIAIDAFSIIGNALLVNISLLSVWDFNRLFYSGIRLYSHRQGDLTPMELFIGRRLAFLFTFKGDTLTDQQINMMFPLKLKFLHQFPKDVDTINSPLTADKQFVRLSLIESMKVMFNLIHNYPEPSLKRLEDNAVMYELCRAICVLDTTDPENSDIIRYILNNLMCASSTKVWFNTVGQQPDPNDDNEALTTVYYTEDTDFNDSHTRKFVSSSKILTKLLDYAFLVTKAMDPRNAPSDATFTSCLACIQSMVDQIYDSSLPDTPKLQHLRQIAESYLLPSETDREYALGSPAAPHSLPHAFVKFSSDISLQSCTSLIYDIYWKCCHEREDELISKMGFGFASGFLSSTSKLFSGDREKEAPQEDLGGLLQSHNKISTKDSFSSGNTEFSRVPSENSTTSSQTLVSNRDYGRILADHTSTLSKIKARTKAVACETITPICRTSSFAKDTMDGAMKILKKPSESDITKDKDVFYDEEVDEEMASNQDTKSCSIRDAFSSLKSSFSSSGKNDENGSGSSGNSTLMSTAGARTSMSSSSSRQDIVPEISTGNSGTDSIDNLSTASTAVKPPLSFSELPVYGPSRPPTGPAALPTPESEHDKSETNIITGQNLTSEELHRRMSEIQTRAMKNAAASVQNGEHLPGPEEWTEEEREREAEKMFDLFERLNRNGIIKTVNPVELARQQGKFESQ